MNKLIRSIIAFSLKNRLLVFGFTALIGVVGAYCYVQTPIVAFPDFVNTQIDIITQWPGISAEDVERHVTIPMEVTMNAVQRKAQMRSRTMFGLSVVSFVFEDGVSDEYARQQILALLPQVDLPPGVQPQLTPNTGPLDEIYRLAIKADTNIYDLEEQRAILDWVVERQIRSVPGVADFNGWGGKEKDYEVMVDPKLIEQYGLTAIDVYNAIQNSNVNVGGDVIERASQQFVVRGIGLLKSIKDIENVVVTNYNGNPIRVKDVAVVKKSFVPRLGRAGMGTNSDVVFAIVLERKGSDPTPICNDIKAKIAELNDHILPPGVKVEGYYDRQTLIDYCTHTVVHNVLEGMFLVLVVVFVFTLDWKSTLILSLTVPLSILFAFIMLYLKGMYANLISIGALDFGILIDGTVVIVEGLFVALAAQAHQMGMERYNKLAKRGFILKNVAFLTTGIFFAQLIIVIALLPIFTFQKVEGKIFSPLAYMLGFALLGEIILTFTFVPALASVLFNKNLYEARNPLMEGLIKYYGKLFDWIMQHQKLVLGTAIVIMLATFYSARYLGTEFIPELDEGTFWVRGIGPAGLSLTESSKMADSIRAELSRFPEVSRVVSQTGRPDDGTDIKNFNNIEVFLDLYPQDEWKSKLTKEELVDTMSRMLGKKHAGMIWMFSQYILDNVNEAVSGVAVNNGLKILGPDLDTINAYADQADNILRTVPGMTDVGRLRIIGQPELNIKLDLEKMALYGVTTANAANVVQMAVGGLAASEFYEGERHFDIRVRYQQPYRKSENDIRNLMVPTSSGTRVPLKDIADFEFHTGPTMIYRDNNTRYSVVAFSVFGRDLGSTVHDALIKVQKAFNHLPKGYRIDLVGEYISEVRAMKRLAVVVPICIGLIFVVLLIAFRNLRDVILIMANVPFALVGGIIALHLTGINFNISAGVGFVALLGVCIQNGVVKLLVLKQNLAMGHPTLDLAIKETAMGRVRPVVMTTLIAIVGLLPASMSHGIGAQTARPFAVVIVGGLFTSILLVLVILPLIFKVAYYRKYSNVQPEPGALI